MLELKDAAGLTPFHLACAAGRNATVQFLLECGSDLHTTDWVAATPLHTAAQRGHLGTVPYTFHKMPDANASPEDYLAVAKHLVEAKANLSAKNNAGQTPFHVACCAGHFDMVKFLFESGSDPHVADNEGVTPLHAAVLRGHSAELLPYLLQVAGCKENPTSQV